MNADLSRSGFTVWYEIIRANTLQHIHIDQMRSVEIGCDFGLKTFTIMLEGDHDDTIISKNLGYLNKKILK